MHGENTQIQVLRAHERVFAAGAVVFDEGDPADGGLYVIQAGEVELTRSDGAGTHAVARLGPGEFVGEMSVVLGEARSERCTAVTEARLLELDAGTLEAMCVERPEVAIRIIRRLSARLIEVQRRLAVLGIDDLLRPVVRALLRRAQAPEERGVPFEVTLRTLAEQSGLSMREAHRALHQLLDRKLLRLVDDVLFAQDLESLSAALDLPG